MMIPAYDLPASSLIATVVMSTGLANQLRPPKGIQKPNGIQADASFRLSQGAVETQSAWWGRSGWSRLKYSSQHHMFTIFGRHLNHILDMCRRISMEIYGDYDLTTTSLSSSKTSQSMPRFSLVTCLGQTLCLLAPAGTVDQGVMQKAGPVRLGIQDCHAHDRYHRVPVSLRTSPNCILLAALGQWLEEDTNLTDLTSEHQHLKGSSGSSLAIPTLHQLNVSFVKLKNTAAA